jgi:hypothetical protein
MRRAEIPGVTVFALLTTKVPTRPQTAAFGSRGDPNAIVGRAPSSGIVGATRSNFISVPMHTRWADFGQPQPSAALSTLPVRFQAIQIGHADDPLEDEAYRVAGEVMRMPDPNVSVAGPVGGVIRRECPACIREDEETGIVRRKSEPGAFTMEAPEIVREVLASPGQPLDSGVLAHFEPRFGHDFSRIRVHTDTKAAQSARELGALAYTMDNHIVFGAGRRPTLSGEDGHLLAHELTHSIQQGSASPGVSGSSGNVREAIRRTGTPLLQRAVDCSLGHLDRECGTATARCAAIQDSYCKLKYPKAADIDNFYKNTDIGAKSRKSSVPNAAANLLHYLDGSGAERVMPVDVFKNHSATKEKLEGEHRNKFIAGGQRRLESGELKARGGQVEMVWTGTANAFNFLSMDDLGLAVGGYTLCSKVNVSAADKGGGTVEMHFAKWTVQAFDCYNWDPGKGIGMPGADDNDLCCLENAHRAMHFRVRCDPWNNDDTIATADAEIRGSSSGAGAGGEGGSKGG